MAPALLEELRTHSLHRIERELGTSLLCVKHNANWENEEHEEYAIYLLKDTQWGECWPLSLQGHRSIREIAKCLVSNSTAMEANRGDIDFQRHRMACDRCDEGVSLLKALEDDSEQYVGGLCLDCLRANRWSCDSSAECRSRWRG